MRFLLYRVGLVRGTVYGILLIIVQGGACERDCVRDSVDNCTGWGL